MNILEFLEIDSASICSKVPINSGKNKTHKIHIKQLQNQTPPQNTRYIVKSVSDLDLVFIKGFGYRAIFRVVISISGTWPTSLDKMKNIFLYLLCSLLSKMSFNLVFSTLKLCTYQRPWIVHSFDEITHFWGGFC